MIRALVLLLLIFEYSCQSNHSHVTYSLSRDSTSIIASENGKIKWQANVLLFCGKPFIGENKIRYYKTSGKEIDVVYGMHAFASIDIETGKIKCLGAD